jgi:hypothetical protein
MYKIYTVSSCTGRDLSQAEKTVGDGEKSTMPRTNFVVLCEHCAQKNVHNGLPEDYTTIHR